MPRWDRSCRSSFVSHSVTVYWHQASQSQHWPYSARRLAGYPLEYQLRSHWYDSTWKKIHGWSRDRTQGPVSRRPTTVKWWQFFQSIRHSTTGTRQTEYHEALPSCSHTSPLCSLTMVTHHDTRFVERRWWNDGWTVKTAVTWRSSASMIPSPGLLFSRRTT